MLQLGASTFSPSGTAPFALNTCGLQLACNKLSTCASTYHLLTMHYYVPPVPGSTWHHHLCTYQHCMHLPITHGTNKAQQEGHSMHFTEPSCSIPTWPMTYNSPYDPPALLKNSHTVPTASLGHPTSAPTTQEWLFYAKHPTTMHGNCSLHDDDYTMVLTEF